MSVKQAKGIARRATLPTTQHWRKFNAIDAVNGSSFNELYLLHLRYCDFLDAFFYNNGNLRLVTITLYLLHCTTYLVSADCQTDFGKYGA